MDLAVIEHPTRRPAHPIRMPSSTEPSTVGIAVPEARLESSWLHLTGGFPLLSIRDLAEMLAVSEHTVRKWVACGPDAGLVPKMLRINGQIRFRVSDVEAYLSEREVA